MDTNPPAVAAGQSKFAGYMSSGFHLERWQKILRAFLLVLTTLIGVIIFWLLTQSSHTIRQVGATGQSLLHSQRLAKSVTQALTGRLEAFAELTESHEALVKNLSALRLGDESLNVVAIDAEWQSDLAALMLSAERTGKNVEIILGQKIFFVGSADTLRTLNRRALDLQDMTESVAALKQKQHAPAHELSTAGALTKLARRIGKSASELQTAEGTTTQVVLTLGKDLNAFKELVQGFKDGNPELKLRPTKDKETAERLASLLKLHEEIRIQATGVLDNLPGMAAAHEAQRVVQLEAELQRRQLVSLQSQLALTSETANRMMTGLAVTAALALALVLGLAYLQVWERRRRRLKSEQEALLVQSQEINAHRVNATNQAAILQLMNEMQNVASGDLTQEATVSEAITGALADSVNYTVEELRSLVGNVEKTATFVITTTHAVDASSKQLLMAASQQLIDIHQAGQAVLAMSDRIHTASSLANTSAELAKQFLAAANSGHTAVQGAMGGMTTIRAQIQETAKRMKRLGESSQEIGEMTDLITDITEQTNVLALNAAIQAATAGEAGRGFTIVAEEVQRLAERSGDATRQISNLVKTIQTDTLGVVAAMEISTHGVVTGSKLAENVGVALAEIDRISHQLTTMIEGISSVTANEAKEASSVATMIQHIFSGTERASVKTKANAQMVRDLSAVAEALKNSIAKFKLG